MVEGMFMTLGEWVESERRVRGEKTTVEKDERNGQDKIYCLWRCLELRGDKVK
jgi:hypothetical protein